MKCTLKPLRDERAREMFAHTAAKRRIANVAVLWAHQIMPSDKARQNRTFAKRYLERDDCSARSAAQAESVNFCG